MEQINLGETSHSTKFDQFTKDEIIQKYTVIEQELARVIKENYELRNEKITDNQLNLILLEMVAFEEFKGLNQASGPN